MNTLSVCLSPILYPLVHNTNATVVIIDVIRFGTSVCTALNNGANAILPLASEHETKTYAQKGYLTAGERDSLPLEGFDVGNSPLSFTRSLVAGKKIAFTTTNGTQTLQTAAQQGAQDIVIGTFSNFTALVNYIIKQQQDVILLCSGWKGAPATDDTVFAGMVAQILLEKHEFTAIHDSVHIAIQMYQNARHNLFDYIIQHSPRLHTKLSWLANDIRYCLQTDTCSLVPVWQQPHLI